MPIEADYQFGRTAVSSGLLSQDMLEECIEVLVALERVGSRKRLWDIIARKGYMSEEAIQAVRQKVDAPSEGDVGDETMQELRLPVASATGLVIAHLRPGEAVQLYPLPDRMIVLGSDSDCDIVLDDADVAPHHARLHLVSNGFAVEDAGAPKGVAVNGRRQRKTLLAPNDLVQLGSALLLYLADYGSESAPEPMGATSVKGAVVARLKAMDGSRKGMAFLIASRPVVIGRHSLANVRLSDEGVGDFHCHIAPCERGGVVLTDLNSVAGVHVNGSPAATRALNDGDSIAVGGSLFKLALLQPRETPGGVPITSNPIPRPSGTFAGTGAAAAQRPVTPQPAEEQADYDVPDDIDLAPLSELKIEPLNEPPRDAKPAPAAKQADAKKTPQAKSKQDKSSKKPKPTELQQDVAQPKQVKAPEAGAGKEFKGVQPGEAQVTCVEGSLEGRMFVLRKRSTLVGREPTCDIAINDDALISRRHAEIVIAPTGIEVRDLGSRNGIYVNGAHVAKAALRNGDTVRVGKCLFIVEKARSKS